MIFICGMNIIEPDLLRQLVYKKTQQSQHKLYYAQVHNCKKLCIFVHTWEWVNGRRNEMGQKMPKLLYKTFLIILFKIQNTAKYISFDYVIIIKH
ncbi:hypothetical protein HanHA300_Chr06g0227261 [Helianthus annuus]|nr:hypothetical protein HanHA300_Chr06g0227261 [Helianthus annuus]KAJ0574877.1 hypothetical protein HanHA89_Chr06g0243231 [Helianthus annuus]KAJ0739207.1 hypothetical protein HanLR1_Chr06g0227281 [Helianthus annuus]KAJ0742058.1 hypothetical protein HanOQP8_Chr06g0235221 [Helianthus annuus]